MPLLTDQNAGILVLLGILAVIGILGQKRGRIAILAALAAVMIIDPFGGYILKPLFARARPCHLEIGRLIVQCGSGYAMPSLHAANCFGAFVPVVIAYRWKAAPLLILAFGIAYSRVYVGVHWPMDVLMGSIYGVGVGAFAGWAVNRIFKQKE